MHGLLSILRLLSILIFTARSSVKSQSELALENLALRQQLAVFKQQTPRPRLKQSDRIFWVWLRKYWPRWKESLHVVQPDTVIRWERQGWRFYWRRKSGGRKPGRPRIALEIRELIRRMARENICWRAPRIHGELLMLGIIISERTVSRYLPWREPDARKVQSWKTFLANHRDVIVAMDFLVVPTVTFRLLYVFFVIDHGRRKIIHVNATAHPTSTWVIQQLREAFPFEVHHRHLIHDRDQIFSAEVRSAIRSLGMKSVQTSFRSPWQNGVAERWVHNCRRELLDHVIVLNENHLRRLVREYTSYYNHDRCHYFLAKDTPTTRLSQSKPSPNANVKSIPILGGLHHRYEWSDAA
jgi:putative transposase